MRVTTFLTEFDGNGNAENRYGNFKLFFNEDAPDDYQPPHFQAADAESNKWFFTTHATSEVPERTSVGKVNAGWHG